MTIGDVPASIAIGLLGRVDSPQVDLMNFRVEYVRPRSGRCLGREASERATGPAGTE